MSAAACYISPYIVSTSLGTCQNGQLEGADVQIRPHVACSRELLRSTVTLEGGANSVLTITPLYCIDMATLSKSIIGGNLARDTLLH